MGNKILFLIYFFCLTALIAAESRIEKISFYGQAIGTTKYLNIYLPQDYDENTNEYYPVLYLHRGHEDEWTNGNQDGSRNGRNIKTIADQLFSEGNIGKVIIVMPGLFFGNYYNHSMGINYVSPELVTDTLGFGNGQFTDYLIDDVIPYIDSHYRTLPSRMQRALDGFSAGGFSTLVIGGGHPHLFSSIGCYDGYFGTWLDFDDPSQPGPLDDPVLTDEGLNAAFGVPPRDVEYLKKYNGANVINDATEERLELLRSTRFLLRRVSELFDIGLISNQEHVLEIMKNKGVKNYFKEFCFALNAEHNWWWADEYMLVNLPLHWNKFQHPDSGANDFKLTLIEPIAGRQLSGDVQVSWDIPQDEVVKLSMLEYSRNDGVTWKTIVNITDNSFIYLWNTDEVDDGTLYRFRITVVTASGYSVMETEGTFTINNLKEAAPDVVLLSPVTGDTVSGSWPVTWYTGDADGDSLLLTLKYSTDNGKIWNAIFNNIKESNTYSWTTEQFANSPYYCLTLSAFDGSNTTADTTAAFQVKNERQYVSTSKVNHIEGFSEAIVKPNITDPSSLTDDFYHITFNDSTEQKTYDVINLTSGQKVVEDAWQMNGLTEGPYFEGLRLLIKDFKQTEIDHDNTGWTIGTSPLEYSITLPVLLIGEETIYGFPYPASYRINIFDTVVDTSSAEFGAPAVSMQFTVWNVSENRKGDILFVETEVDQQLSRNDDIYILEKNANDEWIICWQIRFMGDEGDAPPVAGDEFLFSVLTPLTSNDVYEFQGRLTGINDRNPIVSRFQLFQNYPNPFNPQTTIRYTIPSRSWVTLKVYNILGQEVITLVDEVHNPSKKSVVWNGVNEQGQTISSGIYIYQLRAGSKILNKKAVYLK